MTRIVLNVIVTLYVVYEEGSVSRAAERLSVTQSAVSKSLARARDLLGDLMFMPTDTRITVLTTRLSLISALPSRHSISGW